MPGDTEYSWFVHSFICTMRTCCLCQSHFIKLSPVSLSFSHQHCCRFYYYFDLRSTLISTDYVGSNDPTYNIQHMYVPKLNILLRQVFPSLIVFIFFFTAVAFFFSFFLALAFIIVCCSCLRSYACIRYLF